MKRRMMNTGLKALMIGAVAVGGMTGVAYGDAVYFYGTVDSNWTNGPNWSTGAFPTTTDYAVVDDITADVYSAQTNGLYAVRMGITYDNGVLNVHSNGDVNATVHTSWGSWIGANKDAELNILGGSCTLNFIEVGCTTGATGTINLVEGTLISSRGSKGVSGMSMHLGNYDHTGNEGGTGILNIYGGTYKTRSGLELGKADSGGVGIFNVYGSGAEFMGVGSQGSGDGLWKQYSNSVLRCMIDAGGITPIIVDDYENDGGTVTDFYEGSLLDVGFMDGYAGETGSWTVMLSEGTMTDWGMSFMDTVDTNDWGYRVIGGTNYSYITESVDTNSVVTYTTNTYSGYALQVAYGLGWSAGVVSTNVPPPSPGRNMYWTGNNGDSDPFEAANWDLDLLGTPATWGVYDTDHWKLGNSAYTGAVPAVVDYVNDERFYSNPGTLSMGDGVESVLNVYTSLVFSSQANNSVGTNPTTDGSPAATINVYNGSALQFNALRTGLNGASVDINIEDGAFLIGRGYSGAAYDDFGNSLYLGWNGGGTNTFRIAGGSFKTRAGVTLGGVGTAAVTGIFHVDGSGATEIGVGTHSSVNGVWNQGADGTLKVTIDEGGVTPIYVAVTQATADGKNGDVYFHEGSLLDVDWADGVTKYGAFDVMTWDGTLQTNMLEFAPGVDTNTWAMMVVDTDGNGTSDTLRVYTDLGDTAQGTPIWWLYSYGMDENDDLTDGDMDGLAAWEEYVAGTIPTDSNSVLQITSMTNVESNDQYVISWNSVAGKTYNVVTGSALTETPVADGTGITGLETETSYTGTVSGAAAQFFKIEVQ
jgi:hypothetical protein